ncbi:MAG: FliA/WhiG family RNA polymerase sigma factor [Clostridiales Family XIII bacterium]|jgi:RNA polymerase sigma factor for flagellar operon FliA|nr:FliA/WhiG family RNA polymerase sigma factor [Clostridiales Family XIII bacterium]
MESAEIKGGGAAGGTGAGDVVGVGSAGGMASVSGAAGGTEVRKYAEQWREYKLSGSVAARNEIVLAYMDLVKRIVMRFKGSYNNYGQLDDMVNQGMIALIDAVEKFDPDMGNKFETFASLKIKGAVIDFMRKQDWIPRNQRTLVKELNSAYETLYAEYGREPTKEEIAAKMGVSGEQLENIMQKRHNAMILSYEEAINEKMMTVSPLLTERKEDDAPEAEILRKELKQKLGEAVGGLNEKERLVVSLYYYENLKLKEIAEVMGITESRVSQIHSASIMKLRHKIEAYNAV